jgi:cytochrome c oxidase assembly protein subunit 15
MTWPGELMRSLVSNPVLLHFTHRWWAWVVAAALIILARRTRKTDRRASIALHCALGTQILLGIATVITNVKIPIAVSHQAVAAVVVITTIWCVHILGRQASASD